MTLIVAAGNKDFAVLAADRRLTSNGKLVDDEANKATILACYDARMAIAFTGLATWGSFSTEKWLLESLSVASYNEKKCLSETSLSPCNLERITTRSCSRPPPVSEKGISP